MRYFIDKDNKVIRLCYGMVDEFLPDAKTWITICFNASAWESTTTGKKLTEIPEEKALQLVNSALLDSINYGKLKELILFFQHYRKVQWVPARINDKGVIILGFPNYPEELFQIGEELLGYDDECYENQSKLSADQCVSGWDIMQLRTMFTLLMRQERFCDGILAESVEDGTILNLLVRIEELIKERQNTSY